MTVYKKNNTTILISIFAISIFSFNTFLSKDTIATSDKNKKTDNEEVIVRDEVGLKQINKKDGDSISSGVLNLGPGESKEVFIKMARASDISSQIGAKVRIDSQAGVNTRYLNNKYNLDSFLVPGRSVIDLEFGFAGGEKTFGCKAIELVLTCVIRLYGELQTKSEQVHALVLTIVFRHLVRIITILAYLSYMFVVQI
mgnify:CR=1 FL=1